MTQKKKHIPWNKGLTKETDKRLAQNGLKLTGKIPWNKGLTKDNDERVANYTRSMTETKRLPENRQKCSEEHKGEKNHWYGKEPWNKGLTKETDVRVLAMSEKNSISLLGHAPSERARKKAAERWRGDNNPAKNPVLLRKRVESRRKNYEHWMPEGYTAWCKGLTKETDERILDISKKVSKILTGRPLEEYRKQQVLDFWSDLETKAIQSSKIKKLWEDPTYRSMMEKSREGKYLFGEEHWNWQGGITFDKYCHQFNTAFKEYIREKFNHICFICKKPEEENGRNLAIHHINYDKSTICREKEWLFLPLCDSCHTKTGFNRHYWFNLLINYWAIHPDITLDENILSLIEINAPNFEYCLDINTKLPIKTENTECSLFYFVGDYIC